MNCNVQILTGQNAGRDYDGTLTSIGAVIFFVGNKKGTLRRIVTTESDPKVNVRPLQRASLADLVLKTKQLFE